MAMVTTTMMMVTGDGNDGTDEAVSADLLVMLMMPDD